MFNILTDGYENEGSKIRYKIDSILWLKSFHVILQKQKCHLYLSAVPHELLAKWLRKYRNEQSK